MKKKLLKLNPFKKRAKSRSAEFDRDSEGEHPSRHLRADKPDRTDSTITPDTKSNHGEASQFENTSTLTAGHDGGNATCEWGRL